MKKRNRVTAKVRTDIGRNPQSTHERVIEFMAVGDSVENGSQGGLISIRILDNGKVKIEPYRCDSGVVFEPDTITNIKG